MVNCKRNENLKGNGLTWNVSHRYIVFIIVCSWIQSSLFYFFVGVLPAVLRGLERISDNNTWLSQPESSIQGWRMQWLLRLFSSVDHQVCTWGAGWVGMWYWWENQNAKHTNHMPPTPRSISGILYIQGMKKENELFFLTFFYYILACIPLRQLRKRY